MRSVGMGLTIGYVLVMGCARPSDEPQEIIDNLVLAGYQADDIMVVRGTVYVGHDAEVSLAASREMLQTTGSKEQYHTTNVISRGLGRICVDGLTFTEAVFSHALDRAIQNYEEQPLSFAMVRTPSIGCSFTITAVLEAGPAGGHSGFPSGGVPFGSITIRDGLRASSEDTVTQVITHELGHTIGFRHSDYFDRSISCGGTPVNEGTENGAILIPSTPAGATKGGSIMNSCFDDSPLDTGRFTSTDITALLIMYGIPAPAPMTYKKEFVGCGSVKNVHLAPCPPIEGVPCTTSYGFCLGAGDCSDERPPLVGIYALNCRP